MDKAVATTPTLAVLDGDPAARDALTTLFQAEGFAVHTCVNGEEFVAVSNTVRPDCVLLDTHLPDRSGLDILKAIGGAQYQAPVIMISRHGDIPTAVAAIKAGAYDFVEKPFDAPRLVARVREAIGRRREPSQSGRWPPTPLTRLGPATLTARETEVLTEIVKGASNKEVGRTLGISPRTVEVHRAKIMDKLAARNTADLMRIVLTDGGPVRRVGCRIIPQHAAREDMRSGASFTSPVAVRPQAFGLGMHHQSPRNGTSQ